MLGIDEALSILIAIALIILLMIVLFWITPIDMLQQGTVTFLSLR